MEPPADPGPPGDPDLQLDPLDPFQVKIQLPPPLLTESFLFFLFDLRTDTEKELAAQIHYYSYP